MCNASLSVLDQLCADQDVPIAGICRNLCAAQNGKVCSGPQTACGPCLDLSTLSQVCKPKDFATQINLGMDHCWGIVRALVDMLLKMDEGKYLMVKVRV